MRLIVLLGTAVVVLLVWASAVPTGVVATSSRG